MGITLCSLTSGSTGHPKLIVGRRDREEHLAAALHQLQESESMGKSVSVLFAKDQRYPLFRLEEAVSFTVENTATGRASNIRIAPGVIRPILRWSHQFMEQVRTRL